MKTIVLIALTCCLAIVAGSPTRDAFAAASISHANDDVAITTTDQPRGTEQDTTGATVVELEKHTIDTNDKKSEQLDGAETIFLKKIYVGGYGYPYGGYGYGGYGGFGGYGGYGPFDYPGNFYY